MPLAEVEEQLRAGLCSKKRAVYYAQDVSECSTLQLPQDSMLLCRQQNPSLVVKVIPSAWFSPVLVPVP